MPIGGYTSKYAQEQMAKAVGGEDKGKRKKRTVVKDSGHSQKTKEVTRRSGVKKLKTTFTGKNGGTVKQIKRPSTNGTSKVKTIVKSKSGKRRVSTTVLKKGENYY